MLPKNQLSATLLRSSANGFAEVAASRAAERGNGDTAEDDTDGWQAQLRALVLELAAAVEDGAAGDFAAKVAWVRTAFEARGHSVEALRIGLDELAGVLEESLPPSAWAPIPRYFTQAIDELEAERGKAEPFQHEGPFAELATAYVDALRFGDWPRAKGVVLSEIEAGRLSVHDALEGVLTQALRLIGSLWHDDVISVAGEHFATQMTGRLIDAVTALAREAPCRGACVVLTMVEGDAHDLGLRIVAALFELDGWRSICLGANMPSADLPGAVAAFGADLVVLGATLNTQRDSAARAVQLIGKSHPKLPVVVGGPAFLGVEERASQIGAAGCAVLPSDAVRLGRELLGLT